MNAEQITNAEQIVAEIEWLEALFRLPDKRRPQRSEWTAAKRRIAAIKRLDTLFTLLDERPLQSCDWKTENPEHDVGYNCEPWFQMWKRNGV